MKLLRHFAWMAFLFISLMASCGSSPQTSSLIYEEPELPAAPQSTILGPGLARNVIIMINDGASWGTWDMETYWSEGRPANQVEPYASLPVRLGSTTFPLNSSNNPNYSDESDTGYDPAQAWDTTPSGREDLPFAGYVYLAQNYTDSAAGGTQLSSGVKSYNSAINVNNFEEPLEFVTPLAHRSGLRTGVVTSVEFSHATPATFGANNVSRNNFRDIAEQMLTDGHLDLIMGGGHPSFSAAGRPLPAPSFNRMWPQHWEGLRNGTLVAEGRELPWRLIESKDDFEALARGELAELNPAQPLFGIAPVRYTLQHGRTLEALGPDESQPSGIAQVQTVPDLATMTRGALNYLGQGDTGFFLMVEGGATDWAAHNNELGQIIEESRDFRLAVQAVVDWVDANSNWDETLLIVTTDHGNALPLGPDADTIPFQAVQNNGAGNLPGVRFHFGHHSNEVVRLWARGAGTDYLESLVRGQDEGFARYTQHNADGRYVDATDVARTLWAAVARTADAQTGNE